ncbi:hypothetical protein HBB16_17060 [Pseudonocardia sp. MCCB 268]|nr:hypothetical protein [Pseudonocardia cytotoxica]
MTTFSAPHDVTLAELALERSCRRRRHARRPAGTRLCTARPDARIRTGLPSVQRGTHLRLPRPGPILPPRLQAGAVRRQ